MNDDLENAEEQEPDVQFEELDPMNDIKVLVEGRDEIPSEEQEEGEFKGLTRDQIIEKIASERKANEEKLKQPLGIADEIKRGFAAFSQTLAPPKQSEPQPQIDPKVLEDELKEGLLESPTKVLDKYIQTKLGPEIGRIYQYNINTSRRFLALDAQRAATFKQYEPEVEKEVQAMPLNDKVYDPDVYAKAHDRVVARHMNEIIDAKVKEAVEKLSTPEKKTGGGSNVPFSETKVNRPASSQKVIKLNAADLMEIQRLRRQGMEMDEKTYAAYKYGGKK
jgi:DNA uptake protein ComE-like DNA-binding protein